MLCSRSSMSRLMDSKLGDDARSLLITSVSRGKGSSDSGVLYAVTLGRAIVARGWWWDGPRRKIRALHHHKVSVSGTNSIFDPQSPKKTNALDKSNALYAHAAHGPE